MVDDVLSTAVGKSVLRWRGDPETFENLFRFEVVGNLDSEGAELAEHRGRIFVTTWPAGFRIETLASLYMSPPIPPGGLTNLQADDWKKVWQADDYEPDPVTAATYGGGALAPFDGYLYWGTMHFPFLSTHAHFSFYGETGAKQLGCCPPVGLVGF